MRIAVTAVLGKAVVVDVAEAASRQHFVGVTLVRHVKHEFVVRRVEHVVQCDCRFHKAEVWSAVSADMRKAVEQSFADSPAS